MFIIQNNELLQQAGAISKLIKTSNKFLFNDGNDLSWKLKKTCLLSFGGNFNKLSIVLGARP